MTTTTVRIGLFDPGMSAMHRAGLGGMAMSLRALGDRAIEGLDAQVSDDAISLSFTQDDALALVRFVEAAMYCQAGLIRFAAFADQSKTDVLHMNECLLGTLLQHPKMLEPSGASKAEQVVDIEGVPVVYRVKNLEDFVHRYTARAKLVDQAGRLTTKPIEIKGWAVPGAVQRHSKIGATTLCEPPERLLALLFAPIGVIPMRVVGNSSAKVRFVLLIPEVEALDHFVDRRHKMSSAEAMICAGPGDASLRFFAALGAARSRQRLQTRCTALTLGKVTWSSQQMTRTGVLECEQPGPATLAAYNIISAHTAFRLVRSAKGQGFRTVSSWRHFLTENLAAGRPLWSGLHHATAVDAERRKRMFAYEIGQIKDIVNQMTRDNLLGSETEQRFVEAWHQAISQRWGQLNDRIDKERLDRSIAYTRDFEDMRIALTRCKSADTFRAAVVNIWARAGQNRVLSEHWRDVLIYLRTENWQLGRDLALLALASYRGKGGEHSDSEQSPSSEEENDQ